MHMNIEYEKCRNCQGKGKVATAKSIRQMRDYGLTLKEIAKKIGKKHHESVRHVLKKTV